MGNRKMKLNKDKCICFFILILILNLWGGSAVVYGDGLVQNKNRISIEDNFLMSIEKIALIIEDEKIPNNNGGKEVDLCIFDNKHTKVKLISIFRDTCINTPNGSVNTMGAISDTGSERYIVDTINKSFNLNISEYAKIDIVKLINTVVSIQCIEVDIKEDEALYMKSCGIVSSSIQKLTPSQAVAFTRIPGTNVGGRERSDRIRIVLAKCFEVVKRQPCENYLSLIYQLIPCIDSNICNSSMVKIGMNVLSTAKYNLGEQRIPFDNNKKNQIRGETTYLAFDEKYTKQVLHDYIYEDISP